jgi:hypothetical protein
LVRLAGYIRKAVELAGSRFVAVSGRFTMLAAEGILGCMGGDVASLAAETTPYVSAAVGAYGGAVLARVRDEAADSTVRLGRRLLMRVFGVRGERESLPGPLGDLVVDPGDDDALASVRLAIRKALAADPGLAAEVRSMLPAEPGVIQQALAGRDAYAAGRDQTVINYRRPGE